MITVQVLNDKEFDSLPYYNISDSLGIADKERGLAFVRESGLGKEFDLATLTHEVNHLLETTKTDADEYGIMHKKGGVARFIVPAVLALIPGVGPALAAAANVGMSQYAQSRHPEQLGKPGQPLDILGQAATGYMGGKAIAGGVGGGIAGGTAAAPGFLSKAAGIAIGAGKGAVGGLLGTSIPGTVGGATTTTPAAGSITPFYPSSAPTFAAAAAERAANPLIAGTLLGSTAAKAGITAARQVVPQAVEKVPVAAPGFGKFITPQNILGAGSLLASTGIKQPQFQMPESVEAIRSKLLTGEGLTPLGQQARMELGTILKSTPQEIYPTGTDVYYQTTLTNLENEYQRQKKALAQQWNAIDPNYQYNGEYITANNMLNKSYMEVRNNYIAQEEQRRFELARTAKYQAVQDALGVDRQVMDDLVGLTSLDVQTAAMMYGAQAADVQSLREALGTIGVEAILRGTGIKTGTQGTTINVGR